MWEKRFERFDRAAETEEGREDVLTMLMVWAAGLREGLSGRVPRLCGRRKRTPGLCV